MEKNRMEKVREENSSLLERVCPPKLEDAGLEDCALPPHAIKEAFLKAASLFNPACVNDPPPPDDVDLHDSPSFPDLPPACGPINTRPLPRSCGGSGVGLEKLPNSSTQVVSVQLPEEGRACVEGLEIGEKKNEGSEIGRDEDKFRDEEEVEVPVLAEACI